MIKTISAWIYYKVIGWKLEGRIPDNEESYVLIVVPHTARFDFLVGILIKIFKNLDLTFYAKKELFKFPIGWFLYKLGGAPIDRSKRNNLVQQIIDDYNTKQSHRIFISPEGTRKKVSKFKTGFYYIAHGAQVPILPVIFDYNIKTVFFLDYIYTTGNAKDDISKIEDIYSGIIGKIPEYSFVKSDKEV